MWVLKFHQIINFSQDDFLFLLENLSFFRTCLFIELHIGNVEVKCAKYNIDTPSVANQIIFFVQQIGGKK